jgi:hypothetical protein
MKLNVIKFVSMNSEWYNITNKEQINFQETKLCESKEADTVQ